MILMCLEPGNNSWLCVVFFFKEKTLLYLVLLKHVKNANRSNQDKISYLKQWPQSFHALFVDVWIINIWHCFNMRAINLLRPRARMSWSIYRPCCLGEISRNSFLFLLHLLILNFFFWFRKRIPVQSWLNVFVGGKGLSTRPFIAYQPG